MAVEREALRDWHRLFGLLLTDFFTDSPFVVEVVRRLSEQLAAGRPDQPRKSRRKR